MTLVEVAHRRNQADPLSLAPRRGKRLSQLNSGADDFHADASFTDSRATASARVASASYTGSSSGAFSVSAARWRSTVARSPRAIGPVRAPGPRSAQLE